MKTIMTTKTKKIIAIITFFASTICIGLLFLYALVTIVKSVFGITP